MGDRLNVLNCLGFLVVMMGVVLYKILFHMKRMERKFSYSTGDLADDDDLSFFDDEMNEHDGGLLYPHHSADPVDGNIGLIGRSKKIEYSRVGSTADGDEVKINKEIPSGII
jgi:hypothetical protein